MASTQCPLSPGATLEARQHELDVLAGTQVIRGEIRAGAEVVARLRTTDGDAIGAAARRVRDEELGEHRLVAEILDLEFLLATELPSQLPLPGLRREVDGPPQVREFRLSTHASHFTRQVSATNATRVHHAL